MSNSLKGTLLTVVAGIAWGLSGTSGQYLMAHGISALVLTNLRLLIAGGILMLLAYALYIILPIALIKKWGSSLVIGVGMVIAGLVALPFTGVLQADIPTSLDFLLAFAGIILIGTVFAYTAFLKGASLIGPVKSSLLASIEPISAVFFAFLIMNEQFYPIDFLGMAMILFAVTLISLKDLFLEK